MNGAASRKLPKCLDAEMLAHTIIIVTFAKLLIHILYLFLAKFAPANKHQN